MKKKKVLDVLGVDRNNINLVWEYLKKNVTKKDVEKNVKEIRKYYPMSTDENYINGFAISRTISKLTGGGEVESLLRIENDFAKYLGYTFETQLDNLEKCGHPNKLEPLK